MQKRLIMKVLTGALILGGSLALDAGSALAQEHEAPAPQDMSLNPASGTPLAQLPITRATLANGLRVVLSPDRTVPTVAIAVYYDVGSRNEERGRSGFAHLFEHMMFQGSENVAKGEHFGLVMNRGGSMNGSTSEDRTNYFETLPSNELELGLFLEADRMRSLAVNAENFENQRLTVMEERRQSYENRAYAQSMLRINELTYGDYFPYSHSTIGDMADLQNAPLTAVQEFWRRWYAPNNAVVAISGDFDPEATLARVRAYFEPIGRRDTPAYAPPALPVQASERTESSVDPLAELPAFHLAFHIPPSRELDHYPIEVLAMVLGDGESSRLYQKLVKEREILQDISVSTDDRRGPDVFSVFGIVAQGHTGAEARAVIYEELEKLAREGITSRELEKAKNRLRAYFVFGLQSNLARAQQLAEFEMYAGNAELLRSELDRYLAVSAEDVKRVAGIYFAASNRTVLDVLAPPAAAPVVPLTAPVVTSPQGGAR
jgi:predicted Zn-dependent peptidase